MAALLLFVFVFSVILPGTALASETKVKDVWIDNTVDNSVSHVIGQVSVCDSEGEEQSVVNINIIDVSVLFSKPRSEAVDSAIAEMETAGRNYAAEAGLVVTGVSVTETTGKVWDNRKYTTVEDGDAVLIGDTEYLQGAYGVNNESARTHIASGDYGKETTYTVVITAQPAPEHSITVTVDGSGTASADPVSGPQGTTVTLTATPEEHWRLREWTVLSGGVTVEDDSFVIGDEDVQIQAVFDPIYTGVAFGSTEGGGYIIGTEYSSGEVVYGGMNMTLAEGKAVTVTAVAGEGYRFVGWYEGVIGGSYFVEDHTDTLLSADAAYSFVPGEGGASLCAVFEKIPENMVTVQFDSMGGPEIPSAQVESGTAVAEPETPVWEGYSFSGWFSDEGLSTAYDFSQPVTEGFTLYAAWTETPSYTVASGGDGSWTKGGSDYSLTVKRTPLDETCYSHFQSVELDGAALAAGNDYTAASGSTVITLKAAALEKLSEGDHSIKVVFDDGEASTRLTVKAAAQTGGNTGTKSPATGDGSNVFLWSTLMALSMGGLLGLASLRRRETKQ